MNAILIHTVFLLALPAIVAWFGLSTLTAILLAILMLLWRFLITISGLLFPRKVPELELETISASHFVEKVRWCMDRLGLEYREKQFAGVMGVLFKGRTVPQLRVKTGMTVSVIGDSPDILRYLWGRYSAELGERAAFLEPTPEHLEWEKRIDHYGVQLQVWVYSHLLGHRKLTLHAWGCNSKRIPLWQRWFVRIIYPVQSAFIRKAFHLTPGHFEKACKNIEALLADVESRLESGNDYILGGDQPDFVDFCFASMTGLWLRPKEYGGGAADEVMIARDQLPADARENVERWIATYPKTERYVQGLFREYRGSTTRD
jgi:glutathione S-transferase